MTLLDELCRAEARADLSEERSFFAANLVVVAHVGGGAESAKWLSAACHVLDQPIYRGDGKMMAGTTTIL